MGQPKGEAMRPNEFAKAVVESHIKGNDLPTIPQLSEVEVSKAGAFVSIKTHDGDLRGCIGTIQATRDSVIDEVMHNAISSATRDPRFPPIEEFELENLKFSVDILHAPERVQSLDQLDPLTYGVIVSSLDGRQALLLPDLEGLDTVEKQVSACMNKGGIGPSEKIIVHRFKVDRYN